MKSNLQEEYVGEDLEVIDAIDMGCQEDGSWVTDFTLSNGISGKSIHRGVATMEKRWETDKKTLKSLGLNDEAIDNFILRNHGYDPIRIKESMRKR
jgi:hypothetical protein